MFRRLRFAIPFCVAGCLCAAPLLGQESQQDVFFPRPLEVEHRLVQQDLDGRFESDPVRDTYVGNHLVSERTDGSRLVVDLQRREMTEIRPRDGSYWTIDFDRFADLRRRLALVAGPRAAASLAPRAAAAGGAARAVLAVEARAAEPRLEPRQGGAAAAAEPAGRRFWVALAPALKTKAAGLPESEEPPGQWLEVELDPRWQFSAAATAALARYEQDAFASPERPGALPFEKAMAAVRAQSGLSLAVRTVRPLYAGARRIGSLETEVLESGPNDDFDRRKLLVPEGLRRRPHPLELALQQLEQEARIDDLLVGKPAAAAAPAAAVPGSQP